MVPSESMNTLTPERQFTKKTIRQLSDILAAESRHPQTQSPSNLQACERCARQRGPPRSLQGALHTAVLQVLVRDMLGIKLRDKDISSRDYTRLISTTQDSFNLTHSFTVKYSLQQVLGRN